MNPRATFYYNCLVLFWWSDSDRPLVDFYLNNCKNAALFPIVAKTRAKYLKETFGLVDEDAPFRLRIAVNFKCAQNKQQNVNKAMLKGVIKQALD